MMLDLFERFFPYAYTYLLGLAVLGFCCACFQERLSCAAIVTRLFWFLVGLFLFFVFPPFALFYLLILASTARQQPRS
jgi:hypothetical protein